MKILLATDGSEYSEKAAQFLTRFRLTSEDEVHIVHAMSWLPITSGWEPLYDNFREIRDQVVPKILDSAVEALKPVKAKAITAFRDDYPDKAILDEADRTGADLIVLGARGTSALQSILIGSVTKLVVLKASAPVLIVRPPVEFAPDKLKILFASDGSPSSAAVEKVLSELPFPDYTELTILNVVSTVFQDIPERFSMEINDRMKGLVADARVKEMQEAQAILEKSAGAMEKIFSKIEKITKVGDPSIEIPLIAESTGADIIAIGTRGIRGIKGMFGSVSRYVLNHSSGSILVSKPDK